MFVLRGKPPAPTVQIFKYFRPNLSQLVFFRSSSIHFALLVILSDLYKFPVFLLSLSNTYRHTLLHTQSLSLSLVQIFYNANKTVILRSPLDACCCLGGYKGWNWWRDERVFRFVKKEDTLEWKMFDQLSQGKMVLYFWTKLEKSWNRKTKHMNCKILSCDFVTSAWAGNELISGIK